MNPSERPIPPETRLECDKCWKPAGTCWCRTLHVLMTIGLVAVYASVFVSRAHGAHPIYLGSSVVNGPSANRESIRLNLERDGLQAFDGGDIYVDGTITCPARYHAGAVRADRPTVLRQGPPGSGPLFRLRGAQMQFSGQLQIIGNGVDPVFEVEGSHLISTGFHVWRDIQIMNAPTAGVWVALAGRYEFDEKTGKTGKFIDDVNHADNCRVEGCNVVGSSYTIFRSDNLQALNWWFDKCSANTDTGKGSVICADIHDGGCVHFDGLSINHPRCTIFNVYGVSPNTCYLTCTKFFRDAPTADDDYLTVLDDSKVPAWIDGWKAGRWVLDVSGFVPRNLRKFDKTRLFTKRALYDHEQSRIAVIVSGDEPERK